MLNKILTLGTVFFIIGCASSQPKQQASVRDPAMAKSEITIDQFRNQIEQGNVLNTSLPPGIRKMLTLANEDLQRNPEAMLCQAYFFDSKGNVGELAKHVLRYLTNEWESGLENSPYFNDNIVDLILPERCPQFKTFSPEQKILFWTFVMQNLAFKESSCKPNTTNFSASVPNGPAVGLFQLELRKSLRAWRGEECSVGPDAIKGAKDNTNCALRILKTQLDSTLHLYGKFPIFPKGKTPMSYWYGFNYNNEVWAWINHRVQGMCSSLNH